MILDVYLCMKYYDMIKDHSSRHDQRPILYSPICASTLHSSVCLIVTFFFLYFPEKREKGLQTRKKKQPRTNNDQTLTNKKRNCVI